MKRFFALSSARFLLLLLLPVARAADPTPAPREARLDQLEQRVDHIDRSLEQILRLLQSQQAAPVTAPAMPMAPAADTVQPPAATAPRAPAIIAKDANMKPGVMLDIWLRPEDFRGGVPGTPSLVTILDTRGPLFALGRYADEREMASNLGKPVLQVWRAYLNIKKSGPHVLIAEFRRTTDRKVARSQNWDDFQFDWSAQLNFNGKSLLDETNKFDSAGKGTLSRTFTLELEPGFYAVEIATWLPKHSEDEVYDYKPLTFGLRLREPGALKPRDLGVGDFFCRQ
jgi:hypothetical protein